MINPLLQPIIVILEQNGANEDEIADALTDIVTSATIALYSKAIEAFSEENIRRVELCIDEAKANALIAQIYADKVGISPTQLMDVFLKEYVNNFIKAHEQNA